MLNFRISLLFILIVPAASEYDMTSSCLPSSTTCDQFGQCCDKKCDSFYISQCFKGRSEWKCTCLGTDSSSSAGVAIVGGVLVAIIIASILVPACCIGGIVFLICKFLINSNRNQPGIVIAQVPQPPNQYTGAQYYAQSPQPPNQYTSTPA